MEEKITVQIYNHGLVISIVLSILIAVLGVWLITLIYSFDILSLIGFIAMSALTLFHAIIAYFVPTVVTADSEYLQYSHVFIKKKIRMDEIKKISCEPFFIRNRYGRSSYIMIHITTVNDDVIELKDKVDDYVFFDGAISNDEIDEPILNLYRFIRKQMGYIKEAQNAC